MWDSELKDVHAARFALLRQTDRETTVTLYTRDNKIVASNRWGTAITLEHVAKEIRLQGLELLPWNHSAPGEWWTDVRAAVWRGDGAW